MYGTDVVAEVVEKMNKDLEYDVVIGSRVLHTEGYTDYTALTKTASKVYNKVLNSVGGFRLSDSQCGFKAFRNKSVHDIFSRMKTACFMFDFEALL